MLFNPCVVILNHYLLECSNGLRNVMILPGCANSIKHVPMLSCGNKFCIFPVCVRIRSSGVSISSTWDIIWKDISENLYLPLLFNCLQKSIGMLCLEYIYSTISKFRIFFAIFIVAYFWSRKDEKIGHFNVYLITKQPSCLRKKFGQVNYDLIFFYKENKIIAPEALFLAPSSFKACKHYHFDSVLQFNWKDYVTT